MDEAIYIVVAKYHHQPPIETPAEITTHTKTFPAGATARDIWAWAMTHVTGGYTVLTSLEIRPDE